MRVLWKWKTKELMHRLGHSMMQAPLRYQHSTDRRARQIPEEMDRQITRRDKGKRKRPPEARVCSSQRAKPGRFRRMRFDRYTVILLTLRPDAPVMTDEQAAELQDRHLAHGADLQDRGLVLARGPLTEQDDERFRGFSIWSVDAATAREHAEADPAVRAGRLAVNVMTWMMPAGNIQFIQVRAPRSVAEAMAD